MLWVVLALAAAFFDATYYMLTKKALSGGVGRLFLGSIVFLGSAATLLSLAFSRGVPSLDTLFFPALLGSAVLNFSAILLYYRAFEITDLSLAVPMLSFTPLFLIGTSFLILGELPTRAGMLGIVLIVIGSFFLHRPWQRRQETDTPVPAWGKGLLYMLGVAFLFSLSANVDKIVVVNSDPLFGAGMTHLCIASLFFVLLLVMPRSRGVAPTRGLVPLILLASAALLLQALSQNTAFTMQIVPYVISVKRLNILVSVMYGYLIFREGHLAWRSACAAVMIAGVFLLVLF
jgi:drug/metabolite transporter (DMT)-like permease